MRLSSSSPTYVALSALIVLFGCAGPSADSPPPKPEPAAEASAASSGLSLTPMPDSPKFPGATLTLQDDGPADRAGQVLRPAGPNSFTFAVEGYELGVQTADAGTNGLANSAQGQHIHLIVDNGPYSALYEPNAEVELSEGNHVVLAFLSRSYHESVKEPTAYALQKFRVGDAGPEGGGIDLSGQHMFYSRPKGSYSGADTERLMLDFYLVNTSISPTGNRVRATINGTEFEITEWVPHVIEGLPLGEVEIRLELVDAQGNLIPGPFNQVTRTVTLTAAE